MAFKLPELPYDMDALAPHVSARTLEKHYGAHHKGYVDKINKAIDGTPYADMKLEDIIRKAKKQNDRNVFNNAAQVWNHTFLWDCMSPDGGGKPSGELKDMLDRDFGSLDDFRKKFKDAATGEFGSGWAWLVLDGNKLKVLSTTDAETPVTGDASPVLTLDVWEHAYYLDYQNERGKYVDAFLEELINWEFAAQNVKSIRKAA